MVARIAQSEWRDLIPEAAKQTTGRRARVSVSKQWEWDGLGGERRVQA